MLLLLNKYGCKLSLDLQYKGLLFSVAPFFWLDESNIDGWDESNINSSDYAFNELFINYQAGFIRRGFLGEIFWQLNYNFSIKPIAFFSIFFLLIYFAQIYIFF